MALQLHVMICVRTAKSRPTYFSFCQKLYLNFLKVLQDATQGIQAMYWQCMNNPLSSRDTQNEMNSNPWC